MVDFDYAPDITKLHIDQVLCVVVTPVCLDEPNGIHRLATIPSGAHCRFQGSLDVGMASYSLLRVKVIDASAIPLLTTTDQSYVFGHPNATWNDTKSVVELCAGMGALGQGAISVGFNPVVACELRSTIANLYQQQSSAPMVVGDICQFETLNAVFREHPRSALLAAGISCQPYSRLGDSRSGSDERAQTLPATLSCAHYLRSLIVILECVEPASKDAFVNWHVNQFCIRTGFHRTEAILTLSDIWPCKRTRWWCILSAPAIGPIELPAFPCMYDLPSIRHVLPEFQGWESKEERQLKLTPVELEAFTRENGSVSKYLPNLKGVMPCALHAWGSQLLPCPCGCRTEGLSAARLLSKGLYGVLAPCMTLEKNQSDQMHSQYRHLHPREAALLCGLDPLLTWSSDMRLTLGAVGQLASPLHSSWVFNHIKHGLKKAQFGASTVQPVADLRALRSWLLAKAQQVWNFEEAIVVPSEALALSYHWKPCANLPISAVISEDGSLDTALRALIDVNAKQSSSDVGSVSDLTATQVAIPSQEDNAEISPTSEVPTVEDQSEFTLRLIVTTGNPLNDFDTHIQVRCPATINDVLKAEKEIAQWGDCETQCWLGGFVVDPSTPLKAGMDLSITFLGLLTSQIDSAQDEEIPDTVDSPIAFEHPLTQIKGKAFLNMLPPQVLKVCQAEALRLQKISSKDRLCVLANQGLLWGDDEILWHLQRLCHELPEAYHDSFGSVVVLDPLLACGWLHGQCSEEIHIWFVANSSPQGIVTAFVDQGHWTPIVFASDGTDILTFATGGDVRQEEAVRQFAKKFQAALGCNKGECTFEKPTFEHQCCGAFAVAFVNRLLMNHPMPENLQELNDFNESCRALFVSAVQSLCPHPWTWGAGKDAVGPAVDKLMPFLKDRGVHADQVHSRAQAAVKAIGASEVLKAIESNAPWKNIKSLASNVKFQLVLQTELQQHIAGKAGQEIGKTQKKSRANRVPKQPDPIVLDPNKLQIPDGTFCFEDKNMPQLTPSQIGPLASGIVVITLADADPFLKANQIVSNAPLALLILNAPSSRWSTGLACTQLTVPARCIMNQEPLLLEASLVQIGTGVITKHTGPQKLAIDTVRVSALKVMVYRDEIQTTWETFVGGPVRYIVSQLPILKLCQEKECHCQCWHNPENENVSAAIIDVWRRQYLRQGFKPESQSTATIFSVCIRVPSCIRDQVISSAGQGGVYVEPRTLDAKEVDRSFDVVWVPKADKSTVSHLRQTNPMVAGITRLSDRWGLRVKADQAQVVHQVVRPDAVFLQQGPRLQYSISPIPFGTDRQALSRALRSFGWEVKPIQPVGSVEGGRGNTWNIIATKPPPSNIIPMSHGEVVISTVRGAEKSRSEPMKPVAASSTLNLCGANHPTPASGAKDPWVLQDPWQSYQGPRAEGVSRGAIEATESLKQLEQKIEQAVLSKFPLQPTSMEQDDVPDRVLVLEQQVNSLMSKQQQIEVSIQDHHTQHTAQLSQLQGQLNAQSQQVAGQLESQQQSIKCMFDSQMA